jgi:hypothetical protein
VDNFQEDPGSGAPEKQENSPSTGCSKPNPDFLEVAVVPLPFDSSIGVVILGEGWSGSQRGEPWEAIAK